jgi:NTPase
MAFRVHTVDQGVFDHGPQLRPPDRETAMAENSNHKRHVLLITGAPGIGKTTVMRRVAEGLKHKGLRGFYTEEIREEGELRGFRLVNFDGTTQIIAHVDVRKRGRVGKYGVDVAVFITQILHAENLSQRVSRVRAAAFQRSTLSLPSVPRIADGQRLGAGAHDFSFGPQSGLGNVYRANYKSSPPDSLSGGEEAPRGLVVGRLLDAFDKEIASTALKPWLGI